MKKPPVQPRKPSQTAVIAELAKRYGCDVRTIARWRKENAPLGDPAAMAVWLSERRIIPPGSAAAMGGVASITDLASAKLEKLILECRKLAYKLEVEQRKHIPIDEVHSDMIRIGNATRAECLRLLADAPGWVGLDESAISQRVTDWMTTLCTTLSDDMSKLYK